MNKTIQLTTLIIALNSVVSWGVIDSVTSNSANTRDSSSKVKDAYVEKIIKFELGEAAYQRKDDAQAIKIFEEILQTKSDSMTLDYDHWVRAIDYLGISYGRSGNLYNSRRVYLFGIKLAPAFPNFYYGMACNYAESSDIKTAITFLEMAGQRNGFTVKGKCLPNPRKDSSFRKYLGQKEFNDFLLAHHL
jgi:tetratricopeptide (TPR) repeat protein